MRKTLLFGTLMLVAAAGAVFAARPNADALPDHPPKPPVVAEKPAGAPQPKEEFKRGDMSAVPYTDVPRMRLATDVSLGSISAVAWSADARFFAVQGMVPDVNKPYPGIAVLGIHDGKISKLGTWVVDGIGELVGFTPDSGALITAKREFGLISGFHWLRYYGLPEDIEAALKSGYKPTERKVTLDLPETHGYAFAADGKTFRTVALERDPTGTATKMEAIEVDATTGKVVKSLLKLDYGQHLLSPDGKRLAVLDKEATTLTVHDLDRGAKLSVFKIPAEQARTVLDQPVFDRFGGYPSSQGSPGLAFSADGKRLVLARGIGLTFVLNTDTGEALPALEGTKDARVYPDTYALSGDGRLLAAPVTVYKATERKLPGGRVQTGWEPGATTLTVWDTTTGKAVKTWNHRSARVAFSPARPLLAILERNGENTTRVGFWDFSAEVGKK